MKNEIKDLVIFLYSCLREKVTQVSNSINEDSHIKILRVTRWILRFCHNPRDLSADWISGQLTKKELNKAETVILKIFQKGSFVNMHDARLKGLRTFAD